MPVNSCRAQLYCGKQHHVATEAARATKSAMLTAGTEERKNRRWGGGSQIGHTTGRGRHLWGQVNEEEIKVQTTVSLESLLPNLFRGKNKITPEISII